MPPRKPNTANATAARKANAAKRRAAKAAATAQATANAKPAIVLGTGPIPAAEPEEPSTVPKTARPSRSRAKKDAADESVKIIGTTGGKNTAKRSGGKPVGRPTKVQVPEKTATKQPNNERPEEDDSGLPAWQQKIVRLNEQLANEVKQTLNATIKSEVAKALGKQAPPPQSGAGQDVEVINAQFDEFLQNQRRGPEPRNRQEFSDFQLGQLSAMKTDPTPPNIISTFNGEGQNIRDWIDEVEYLRGAHHWTNVDTGRLAFVKLQGRARDAIVRSGLTRPTFSEMQQILVKQFATSVTTGPAAYATLAAITQANGENITAFMNRVEDQVYHHTPGVDSRARDSIKISTIIRGLSLDNQAKAVLMTSVMAKDDMTMSDFRGLIANQAMVAACFPPDKRNASEPTGSFERLAFIGDLDRPDRICPLSPHGNNGSKRTRFEEISLTPSVPGRADTAPDTDSSSDEWQ